MHHSREGHHNNYASCGPGYPSLKEFMEKAEREKVLYTMALYVGADVEELDYLVTVDMDPESSTYSQVVHRIPMPNVEDELHHFGWNACSSCHGDESKSRRVLIVLGQRSSCIHVIDTADERTRDRWRHRAGGKINEEVFVDFGTEPAGPVRAHEMRYPRGDITSDVWI